MSSGTPHHRPYPACGLLYILQNNDDTDIRTSAIRAEKLEKEGELETNDLGDCGHFIGTGGMEALPVLVCLYRNDFGGISIGSARCGGTMRLPWNPLAKWS